MSLATYPYVVVRLACNQCPRRGQYRLARLAARFGPEADAMAVARALAEPCPRLLPPAFNSAYPCGVHFPDLPSGHPPDLPPAPAATVLRVVGRGRWG